MLVVAVDSVGMWSADLGLSPRTVKRKEKKHNLLKRILDGPLFWSRGNESSHKYDVVAETREK